MKKANLNTENETKKLIIMIKHTLSLLILLIFTICIIHVSSIIILLNLKLVKAVFITYTIFFIKLTSKIVNMTIETFKFFINII
ncbi:hypothetical protein A0H76_1189 [Hepatospora eriocheir]|uniref:Uncharacterized protein n=1 Tax=Hepatospora eriocheir TaxID=1081669 RepID=A0A1X0QHJ0_9MICR|nr:hypothetical protein A0H76_1189 [Hepatospora eriocheir]